MFEHEDIAALVSETTRENFKDPRLVKRLGLIVSKVAANPSMSFPKIFSSSAELEAAYRFFANPVVTPDAILDAHFKATQQQCKQEPVVLVVHDTSTFAFNPEGDRVGLGRVGKKGQAFFGHCSLALSDDGSRKPLGVAALKTWIRGVEPKKGDERPRWIEAVRLATDRLGETEKLVHIMDREADDYQLFEQMIGGHHRFIIRLAHDRLLAETSPLEPHKIREASLRITSVVHRDAKVSKRVDGDRLPKQKKIHPSRAPRTATLSIGASRITLKRPAPQSRALPDSLAISLVRVWEAAPPNGEEPIEWLLATTEPIETQDDLLRIVDRYRARWTIEEFFKGLKTGCSIEERQLGDYEGLVNALAVFLPIACRMLWLRSEASRAPDAPALRVATEEQLEVLRALGPRKLPTDPTTSDVLLAIAALGGHIKWNGPPGWLTISRGYTELLTLTRAWSAAKLQYKCDQS